MSKVFDWKFDNANIVSILWNKPFKMTWTNIKPLHWYHNITHHVNREKDGVVVMAYDNWNILQSKQQIGDLLRVTDKNQLSQYASETTKSSHRWQALQHTTSAIKDF